MKWLLFALLVAHGLVHFIGPTKAFGIAEVPELTQPISRFVGLLWLVAGVAFLSAAFLLFASPRAWWIVGLLAVALSQALVLAAWSDARFATLPNLLVLAACLLGVAAFGPRSLRAQYERDVRQRLEGVGAPEVITDFDLRGLPDPVRRYLRFSGVVGAPRVHHFAVTMRGRIRAGPEDAWMEFTSVQTNFVAPPSRFFFMDARKGGLPVDVLHSYRDGTASMWARLLSVVPVARMSGAEADRAETVTLFNDLCLFAPAALLDSAVRWETIDELTARGYFSAGSDTVSAVLHFNQEGQIVDFVSDDRLAASDDYSEFRALRWSTPVLEYGTIRGRPLIVRGEGRWHPPEGAYSYIELDVIDVDVNGPWPGTPIRLANLTAEPPGT